MHPIAHATITATVVTSALGALVLCLLVFRYGFEPPEDESLDARHRRFFVTRLGHAAGAVFFAITAGLAGIALGLPAPRVAEAPRPAAAVAFAPAGEVATLRAEHRRLGEIVHGLGQAVQGLGDRVTHAEGTAQRLSAVVTDTVKERKRIAAVASRPATDRPVPALAPVRRGPESGVAPPRHRVIERRCSGRRRRARRPRRPPSR
jgi:hypothetical protein